MAEILTTIVGLLNPLAKIKEYVIDPLKGHFSHLCCPESIFESLKTEVQKLDDSRDSLQRDVDVARRNLQIIRLDVERWLESANKIKEKTDKIFEALPEVEQGCANVSCPNLKLRYFVSREAEKLTKELVEIRAEGKFDRVGHPASPAKKIPRVYGTEFESRKTTEEGIMAALTDESIYMIGICGMGGVGKTTMVKKIGERAREENLFDVAAMAVVSQQPDLKKIQREIAEASGLQLEKETEIIRAAELCTRLKQEKRILIILDDVWASLNLEELGIPSQSNHKGCKIILTSRNDRVCKEIAAMLRHVGTETEATETENTRIFPLKCLDEEEAWSLFRAKAGSCVADGDLHQTARDVAKECKGLPLALVTVGCALADQKAKYVWEDALEQLKMSAPSNIPGVLEGVYQPLEWSYKQLESDEVRDLFLLCCLFPEDSPISLINLLYYGVGLRIFSNVETLKKARNRVYGLVEMLESRNMLMDDCVERGLKYVKMHDVIRDMAIYIASTGKHVFMSSHGLEDWPRKDSYENYTCISLTLEEVIKLPEHINSPALKMLRIRFQWRGRVPDTFFEGMKNLNVLDIDWIISLPSSLQFLENLRILRLHYSRMKNVSMLGQLVNLEILDLKDSTLEVLPEEIGGLEKLKSLDLCGCEYLREIAPGVISRLTRLEELLVLDSFKNWEAEVIGKERGNASLVEVASLKNLTALQLRIPDPKVLPQDALHWPKLERFAIWMGTGQFHYKGVQDYEDNHLAIDLNETTPLIHALTRNAHRVDFKLGGMGASDEVIKWIQEGNQNLKSLMIDGCGNMKCLANILSKESIVFPKLRLLWFSNCRDLEGIWSGGPPLVGSFDALERLILEDLCKLTHLGDEKFCLPNLSHVFIQNCSSLQYVFSQSTVENLPRLHTLYVEECPILEEVFKAEIEGSADVIDPIAFLNLTKLRLNELPNLNSFCKAVTGLESSHNSDSQILFHQKVTFSRLKQLGAESCPILEVIFPCALRNFRALRNLSVKNCSKLKEVVEKEDKESQAAVNEPLFPELEQLTLLSLPNFKTFCHVMNDIDLPQLQNITIVDCPQKETFSLGCLSLTPLTQVSGSSDPDLATQIFFKKEGFASLVNLELSNVNATKIFSSQIPVASFSQLRLLQVNSCPNLEVIFSPPSFRNFRSLKELRIHDCWNLEAIVGKEDEKAQAAVEEPLFPELKTLTLKGLPNFKKFCHMKIDIEWQKLESVTLDDCPQMECAFGLLDPNVATQFFHNREVTFASLVNLTLCNLRTTTKIFSSQNPISSFSRLKRLKVDSCSNLKVIFSPSALRNFGTLCNLTVTNCSKLEEVVREEVEESQAIVIETLFPELKNLELSKLPNIKTFCYMKNGIELPKLENIRIQDCHEMETFSIGSLRLPRQFYVFGLLEPDLATQIFLKKQAPKHEIHLENNSFTLSAKDLLGFESIHDYIKKDEWCLAKDSIDNFIIVARLNILPELRIDGRFEMEKLSPRTLYEVVFEIMLEEPRFQLGGLVNLELTSSKGITQERSEDLKHLPRKEWIEVLAGEFTTAPDPIGDLEFTLYKDKDPSTYWRFSTEADFFDGLLVKGVTIRPKA